MKWGIAMAGDWFRLEQLHSGIQVRERRDSVHMPDASGSGAVRAGELPEVRDGAGASGCGGGSGAGPRICFDAVAILGERGAEFAGVVVGDVWREISFWNFDGGDAGD